MSAARKWEPGRNAVHRLLQLCDVLAIALNRFRQLSFRLPSPPDPQFETERNRLQTDYFAIAHAVFPTADIAPQHTAFRLATDAVAELVRAGSRDANAVGTAQEWMAAVGWILVPHPYPTWTLSTEAHKPFDEEFRTLQQHAGVRQGLLAALARVGQSVPAHVQQRASIASHSWSQSQAEPVTQAQLLDWVRETQPADTSAHAPAGDDSPPAAPAPLPNGTNPGEGETPPADVGGLVQRFRCYNCDPPHEFSSAVPVCPQCGVDARKPQEQPFMVKLVTTHFDPPHPVLRGYGPGPFAHSGRGQGIMACTGTSWPPGTSVSGVTAAVTCPTCREMDAYKAAEAEQHPPDATDRARKSVDERVSTIRVDPPPGLDPELADAFSAIALGIRECTRLMASVPHLWRDADEYRRLAACVTHAATAAHTAYTAVDIRLRRVGGPNPMREALNDVLTVQGRSPPHLSGTPDEVNAILTNLYLRRSELFSFVDGRGCIDRILEQLARVPPATNTAADPPPAVTAGPAAVPNPGEGEKPKSDHKPDGPFDADGFRFAGVEVKFGKAGKQYRLVMALWDAEKNRPAPPRPVDDVITEVWGDENETEDSTFRQMCADTRRRFQAKNCPLDIQQTNGKVQLAPL